MCWGCGTSGTSRTPRCISAGATRCTSARTCLQERYHRYSSRASRSRESVSSGIFCGQGERISTRTRREGGKRQKQYNSSRVLLLLNICPGSKQHTAGRQPHNMCIYHPKFTRTSSENPTRSTAVDGGGGRTIPARSRVQGKWNVSTNKQPTARPQLTTLSGAKATFATPPAPTLQQETTRNSSRSRQ